MIQETLLYHVVTIELFLLFLFVSLFIPLLFKREKVAEIRATRISYFIFSALLSMVVFTGAILYLLAEMAWSIDMTLMAIASILLSGVEIARSIRLKKSWLAEESAISLSWRYVLAEIMIVILMMIFMM
ncbi:MAG: hypothetical protein U9R27_11850 [Campylobacterota bacterium]|nr:hypothetical protein [Campylobacterota bacterium]